MVCRKNQELLFGYSIHFGYINRRPYRWGESSGVGLALSS